MAGPITLYAREEQAGGAPLRRDTCIYHDKECTRLFARWKWYRCQRPVGRKHVTLNCYRYALEWV